MWLRAQSSSPEKVLPEPKLALTSLNLIPKSSMPNHQMEKGRLLSWEEVLTTPEIFTFSSGHPNTTLALRPSTKPAMARTIPWWSWRQITARSLAATRTTSGTSKEMASSSTTKGEEPSSCSSTRRRRWSPREITASSAATPPVAPISAGTIWLYLTTATYTARRWLSSHVLSTEMAVHIGRRRRKVWWPSRGWLRGSSSKLRSMRCFKWNLTRKSDHCSIIILNSLSIHQKSSIYPVHWIYSWG